MSSCMGVHWNLPERSESIRVRATEKVRETRKRKEGRKRRFINEGQNGEDQRHVYVYEEHKENERICQVIDDGHLDREKSEQEMLLPNIPNV